MFVEFQKTTCLFATTAEIMLRMKTVALRAPAAPGARRQAIPERLVCSRLEVRLGDLTEEAR